VKKSPTDFLISAMENMDDVVDVLIVRRHTDGCIGFDSASGSRFDSYAMCCATKASLEGMIVRTEMEE
jgi:hypothetical protein